MSVCVSLSNQRNHKIIQERQNFAETCRWLKKETHRTWILAKAERYSKQPGRSWISSVSLGEFAMASHNCCTPFECFCFLLGEKVFFRTSYYANTMK